MKRIDIDDLASVGFTPDLPELALPKGAWGNSRNVRYRDGAMEKCRGFVPALGTLTASTTVIWASPVSDGVNYFWVYGTNTVLYATDGTGHANINNATIVNAATDDLGWSGGGFHGFMIANDGVGIPQSWVPGLGNDFLSLTAWPAAISCKIIRPFGDFLIALRITDGGSLNARVLRWSDKAQQGGLPLSWDFNDPTNQAGITELGQTPDSIVDGLPLRDFMVIYKENHTWLMNFVGGGDVFGFRQVFSQIGMLTENCVAGFGANHLVLTGDDLVAHDGTGARSVVDRRARRWLFNSINTNRYKRCFIAPDHRNREMYVCFPEAGNDWPNMALVWNWAYDTLHPFELGGLKTWGTPGIIPGSAVTFDADAGTFDQAVGVFDEETFNPFTQKVIFFDSTSPRALQNDTGEDYAGVQMPCFAERNGFMDLMRIRRIWRLLPQVSGNVGDTLRFLIGIRDTQGSPISWTGPHIFTIGTDYKIDLRLSGRLLDLRIEYSGLNTFRLNAVGVEFEEDGTR